MVTRHYWLAYLLGFYCSFLRAHPSKMGGRDIAIIVYVCMYIYLCVAGRTVAQRWSKSFSSWLVWQDSSSSFIRCKQFRLIFTYLFSTEVTPPPIITFLSLCLVDLWQNRSRCRNNFIGQLLWKWVYKDFRTTSTAPLLHSPRLGVENIKLSFRRHCILMHIYAFYNDFIDD